MTNNAQAELVVTQADREAAADFICWQREATQGWKMADGAEAWQFFHDGFSRGIRQGIWDEHYVVQAFARHRTAQRVLGGGE